ncbi:MAG: hypothetical protein ABIT04_06380 [Novosphingobium sp.]
MHITKSIGMAAAGLAAIAATPALAATYNLGTLPNNTYVNTIKPLTPLKPSDTITFMIGAFGNVSYNLFGRVPNAVVKFFYGAVGSGKAVTVLGTKSRYFYTPAGNYYAVVTGAPRSRVSYNLRLKYEPAPAPGPAGFLVFGAGAAFMAARKRRANAKAAA